MSKTLANLALSASLLASSSFAATATPEAAPTSPQITPVVTLKLDQPVPRDMLAITVAPDLAPLSVKIQSNLFGNLTERFALCVSVKRWAEISTNLTPELRGEILAIARDGVDQEISSGRLKFEVPVNNTPVQNATALNVFKDKAAEIIVEENFKAGREVSRMCNTSVTDPSSPWFRGPQKN